MKKGSKKKGTGKPARRPRRVRTVENHGENHGGAPAAEKPATPESELRPQPHGGALRNGGTNKGGPGRPSNELREWAREILTAKGKARIERILDGMDDDLAIKAFKELRQLGVGSKVEVEGTGSPIEMSVTVGPEVAAEREAKRKEAADGVG